jgi:hypothetical protein
MQEDGEEETKGFAKRAIGEGLDVTTRKANVTFMRVEGVDPPCSQKVAARRRWPDWRTGSVRKCLSILDRQTVPVSWVWALALNVTPLPASAGGSEGSSRSKQGSRQGWPSLRRALAGAAACQ